MSDREQRVELRRFLQDRRARVSPAEVGLPSTGRRRVPGLRREEVASLAGIGVSWYTALENGDAAGVSEATLAAVAQALRLSDAERQYLIALAGRLRVSDDITPSPLVVATMNAISFPAYIITADWDVLDCNEAFRCVWDLQANELPFNAVERLFIEPAGRKLQGAHFEDNIAPVVAMLRSAVGRRPSPTLRALRDRLMDDEGTRKIWNQYEISSPVTLTRSTIDSPVGSFSYQALTLPLPDTAYALVVQVPDAESRNRFALHVGP